MTVSSLLIIGLAVFGYALISSRLSARAVTAPMVFVAVGWVLGSSGLGIIDAGFDEGSVELLAEATLVLVLFADATRIDLGILRRQIQIPARLLAIGLPLSIGLGGALAGVIIDGISTIEGFLIGAILAPTDAALGQAVVADPAVPVRIRQALNVESGLNDGIALPVVVALAALASGRGDSSGWVGEAGGEILFGVVFGVAVGALCGTALRMASEHDMVEGIARQVATLSVPAIAFAITHVTVGNGFIAAFVAGVAFGHTARDVCDQASEFTEDQGQLLTWITFMLFGVALVGPALAHADWRIILYVVLSLTVIRMVPVAVASLGSGLMAVSVAFVGWFGPRGLASILFVLLVLDGTVPGEETVLTVVVLTVLASVVLHGFSARPLARRYGAAVGQEAQAEMEEVEEMRSADRIGLGRSSATP